jgi:hypothetical protein
VSDRLRACDRGGRGRRGQGRPSDVPVTVTDLVQVQGDPSHPTSRVLIGGDAIPLEHQAAEGLLDRVCGLLDRVCGHLPVASHDGQGLDQMSLPDCKHGPRSTHGERPILGSPICCPLSHRHV